MLSFTQNTQQDCPSTGPNLLSKHPATLQAVFFLTPHNGHEMPSAEPKCPQSQVSSCQRMQAGPQSHAQRQTKDKGSEISPRFLSSPSAHLPQEWSGWERSPISQLRVPPLPAKCPMGTDHGSDSRGSHHGKPYSWNSIQDVLGTVL